MARPAQIFGLLLLACAFSACSKSSEAVGTPDAAPAPPAERAPYTLTPIDKGHIGSKEGEADFHKTSGELEAKDGPFADAKLIVDLESSCFPFDKWKAEPPPPGHNFPASCDAFDRNLDVALFDPAQPDQPGLELIHAITPFGGPLHLELDVTDIFQTIRGKRRLEIKIPSYSDSAGKVSGSNGGWTVTARIEVTPGDPPRNVLAVVPIVYDGLKKGGEEQRFSFVLPEGTAYARLEYLASGHGGGTDRANCIGPADEFCWRKHTLRGDDAEIVSNKELWRTNCDKLCTTVQGGPFGSYCKENPCGHPDSVRAARANWCPGSETPALVYEPAAFAKGGAHTLGLTIDTIAEGGVWNVSAKVFAYAEAP